MGQVYQEDGAKHYNDDADGSDPNKKTGQNRYSACELGESNQITHNSWRMHESGKALRAWPAKCAK
jgi:hypothetical protein